MKRYTRYRENPAKMYSYNCAVFEQKFFEIDHNINTTKTLHNELPFNKIFLEIMIFVVIYE